MPNKELLIRYAELKIQAKKIEEELDMMKAEALREIQEIQNGADIAVELQEFPGYSFVVEKRKTWTYSRVIEHMQEELKDEIKQEQADGTATFEEAPQLKFNSPKNN